MELPRVEPVFVRAREIPDFKSLREFEMCQSICKRIESDKLLGVQRIGMLWRVYLKDRESRAHLLVNNLEIRNQTVNVFSNNPMRAKLAEGETDENVVKITIRDLPISKGNQGIEVFLKAQGIKIKSAIQYSKTRDENNRLTDWLNGDRVVFVEKFNDPLPRKTWINDTSVRIFHRDQPSTKPFCTKCQTEGHFKSSCTEPERCVVCKEEGHKAGDKCCTKTAKQNHKHVTAFAGRFEPLSNFYPCEVNTFGMKHKSSEHAYQYAKAIQIGKDKIANRIMEASSAFQAKTEASYLPFNPHWIAEKEKVMQNILSAKARSCPEFREALLNSQSVLAEAVPGELFWATGLSKDVTMCVKKASWPGKNKMGKILAKLKEELLEAQKRQLRSGNKGSQRPDNNNDVCSDGESEYNYGD